MAGCSRLSRRPRRPAAPNHGTRGRTGPFSAAHPSRLVHPRTTSRTGSSTGSLIRSAGRIRIGRQHGHPREQVRAGLATYDPLASASRTVPRQGKDYVTAHDPECGKRWRLKGALYEHDFSPERLDVAVPALSAQEPRPTANRSNRWRFSAAGNSSRTPASREALAQSRSKSYCHCSWRPPNHCIPLGEMTQRTLARSHGPRHPEIVSCTDLLSFSSFHCCLIRSRGTAWKPLSVRPQQQPSQSTICPRMRPRAVASGSCLPSVSRMR